MPHTGLSVFDTTLQKTNELLALIRDGLQMEDRHQAYSALRSVLHTLRDRLSVSDAAHLASQLPMLVRGIFYEGWKPEHKPERFSRQQFIDRVRAHYGRGAPTDIEEVIEVVWQATQTQINDDEVEELQGALPKELEDLFAAPNAY